MRARRTRHMVWGIGLILMVIGVFPSCNVCKFVPEDKQLLYKTKIEVVDNDQIQASNLKSYLRQTQNAEILGFWKLQLHVYNTAPADTTKKSKAKLARNAMRIGEAPEIYRDDWTQASMKQLQKAMRNKGYFDAQVDTSKVVKDQKMYLTYQITANQPYTLRNCSYMLPQQDLKRQATSDRTLLHEGMLFDSDELDAERQRISSAMRQNGYFYFDKDMLCYIADSTHLSRQIDVQLKLKESIEQLPDSQFKKIFTQYTIRQTKFVVDSGLQLRPKMLERISLLVSGTLYNEQDVSRTYDHLYQLGAVKYVDISFVPVGENELDCVITLARNKLNTVSAEIEGTYSAGDWGIGGGVGYINKNIFHGAEELSLNAKAGYEWRQNGGRGVEAKASAGLRFPNAFNVNLNYHYQDRPEEYIRTIANLELTYTYRRYQSHWLHAFRFFDLSYVYLPWISDEFRAQFLQPTNILKYSYENHFIDAIAYRINYTSYREKNPYRSYGSFYLQLETAGNAMYGLAKLCNFKQDKDGHYLVGTVGFAQYAKVDFNFTGHAIANEHHRVVFHGAVGVAIPYGNADAIPFEKRYFVGGANSIRGWISRALGPGGYCGTGDRIDYNNQAGDIKLEMNAEYRWLVWNFIELAAFVDAGNIWTIREYESQPHGLFEWSEFYKQLAVAYGAGLRLNLNFLVLRLDFGFKLYDPSHLYTDQRQWRTVGNGLSWKNDAAVHFAIGYPF